MNLNLYTYEYILNYNLCIHMHYVCSLMHMSVCMCLFAISLDAKEEYEWADLGKI